MKTARKVERQARRLPLPDAPTVTLVVDDVPAPLVLDRVPEREAAIPVAGKGAGRARVYMGGGVLVIVTPSIHGERGRLLHVSISLNDDRLPSWPLLKAVKQAFFPPDVAAMIVFPEEKYYVNLVEALHIIQCPGPWGTV